MKDINELLRRKETELQQLQRDVEALRVASRLLQDETETAVTGFAARPTVAPTYVPPRPLQPSAPAATDAGYSASWDAASKKFP